MPKPAITRVPNLAITPVSTNKNNGLYAPQLTTAQITAIPAATAVNGGIVYNTTTNTFQVYKSGNWTDLTTSANLIVPVAANTGTLPVPPANGMIVFQTDITSFKVYNGEWGVIATGIGAGSAPTTGTVTLVSGTATVVTSAAKTASHIFLQTKGTIGVSNSGNVRVSAISDGTNFIITSTDGSDTSQVDWFIVNS